MLRSKLIFCRNIISFWHKIENKQIIKFFSTPGDDSCYKYHAGFEEFGDAVKAGIHQGLHNDIMSYSRRPGVITNGAIMRREQWYNWFASNVDIWLYEVDTIGERKCLTDKFPYDSPGDLDKERVLELISLKFTA